MRNRTIENVTIKSISVLDRYSTSICLSLFEAGTGVGYRNMRALLALSNLTDYYVAQV